MFFFQTLCYFFVCVSSLRIHFPDPHSRYRSSQITIIGGLENVFDARHKIMVKEGEGGREGRRERGREGGR